MINSRYKNFPHICRRACMHARYLGTSLRYIIYIYGIVKRDLAHTFLYFSFSMRHLYVLYKVLHVQSPGFVITRTLILVALSTLHDVPCWKIFLTMR